MSRRTRNAYDRWSATYDTDPNPQIVLEEEAVLAEMGDVGGLSVLDAGCGTGRYAGRFQSAGARVVGLDFSFPMLSAARLKYPSLWLVGGDLAQPLPFRDDLFDRVICTQTLKHLASLDAPVTELARVLKPTGVLVFSVTHPEMTWDGYEMRETPAFILSEEADIHHHQLAAYRTAIERAGLRCERVVPVPVSDRIREYLTETAFSVVRGRSQVAVFRAVKETALRRSR